MQRVVASASLQSHRENTIQARCGHWLLRYWWNSHGIHHIPDIGELDSRSPVTGTIKVCAIYRFGSFLDLIVLHLTLALSLDFERCIHGYPC